jgi:hypothetical protein
MSRKKWKYRIYCAFFWDVNNKTANEQYLRLLPMPGCGQFFQMFFCVFEGFNDLINLPAASAVPKPVKDSFDSDLA